jgi:ribosomal protein S18 acetylase RimI-like enzyme
LLKGGWRGLSTSRLTLRDGSLEDVPTVQALWWLSYEPGSQRSMLEDVTTLLAHGPSARLLAAEQDGRLVGTLIVTFDGWRGNMYRLAVHPDFRRRGIAKRLVEQAHAWLRAQGCLRITALVEAGHEYATGFWEAAGYTCDANMHRYSLNLD